VGTAIGRLFRLARTALGLSLGETVKRAGYANVSKGANKLLRIERGVDPFPAKHLLERFGKALALTEEQSMTALCEEFCELDKPIKPEAIVRLMPAVYVPVALPDGASPDEAVRAAKQHSTITGRKVFVRLSRIRGVYVQPDGISFESYDIPWSSLGGAPGTLRPWLWERVTKRLSGTSIERGAS